jgi:hypothetical protein
MKSTVRFAVPSILALLAVLLALPAGAQPVCVSFEPPAFVLGTTYGAPVGQVSGDLAFVSNGISGFVYKFNQVGGGTTFNRAFINVAPVSFSPGQSLRTNNINLQFDFSGVGFRVKKVTLSYLDLGGYENLAVNGSSVYVGELTSAPATLGGVSVGVTSTPVPPPTLGKMGTVTLKGPVATLRIGGQEFWIDSVCAQ